MVTDILILAEKMRLFGNTRYTLASLYYLFNLNYLFNKSIRNIDIKIDNEKKRRKNIYLF